MTKCSGRMFGDAGRGAQATWKQGFQRMPRDEAEAAAESWHPRSTGRPSACDAPGCQRPGGQRRKSGFTRRPLRKGRPAVAALAAAMLLACAGPTHRTHPDLATRWKGLRTVGVVEPMVPLYELDAAGGLQEMPEWTQAAEENLAKAISSELEARGIRAFPVVSSLETEAELTDATQLFTAVARDVLFANYVVRFAAPAARFQYSVGDLSTLAQSYGVDGFVFAVGQGQNSSAGRTAAEVGKTIAGLLAALGGGRGYEPQFGLDWLAVGLVDAHGDLLWFGVYDSDSGDLRSAGSASYITHGATEQMPPKGAVPPAQPGSGK